MYLLKCVVASLLIVSCIAADNTDVAQAFLESKIVPNVEDTAPTKLVTVHYDTVDVNLGNEVSPLQTLTQPNVTYEFDADKNYTLVFCGPNLPLDLIPRYKQLLHWMVVNIPGSDIKSGNNVAPYIPPAPYPLGLYYKFFVYLQTREIDAASLSGYSLLRPNFDVVEFKQTQNLTGPVAGNFMKETYVPSLGI